MAAYAEGFNILRHANVGASTAEHDAETTPLREPRHYQYDFKLDEIAEVWRHGSVIGSWLLDLTAAALAADPTLEKFGGRVSDSGEGRWALQAANDEGVPAHVLACRVVRAIRLARSGRLPEQGAVGDAIRLRRPHGEEVSDARPQRRAGVLRHHRRSGLQEDLSRAARDGQARQARRAGDRRSRRSDWTREQLVERARESITAHGELDDDAFAKLASLIRYVDGDYNDPATFARLKQALGSLDAAAALLRDSAEHVSRRRQEPGRRRLPGRRAHHRREAVRPRSAIGARAERDAARVPVRAADLPHRSLPRQGGGAEHPVLPLRERAARAAVESPLRRERADHHGGSRSASRAAASSTKRPA